MKYRVLKALIYSGTAYEIGQEVDILEKSVAENCLERGLIEEIKEIKETKETKETEETEEIEETKETEDTAEEVVSSETLEDTDTVETGRSLQESVN